MTPIRRQQAASSEYDRQREEGRILGEDERRWGTCERCHAILYGHRCWWCEPEEAESPTAGWDDVDWGAWAEGREIERGTERRGRHTREGSDA